MGVADFHESPQSGSKAFTSYLTRFLVRLLTPSLRKVIKDRRVVHVASISLLEIARKEARGELVFGMPLQDWFRNALPQNRIELIEISPQIAIDATRLPEWEHKDPADRLIVATARVRRLSVISPLRNPGTLTSLRPCPLSP